MRWLHCENVRSIGCAVIIAVAFCMSLTGVPSVDAKDLIWDRNSETDMQDYQVWACQTVNCVVLKTQANLLATVPQTASGVLPKWTLPSTLTEGSMAVSARDKSLNESGLSVPVPFDQVSPAVPANPRLQ